MARQLPESILCAGASPSGAGLVRGARMCFEAVLWHMVRNSGAGPL